MKIDHSYFLNLPVAPVKVRYKKSLDVWSETKVNLFSKKYQEKHPQVYTLPLTSRCKFDGIVPYFRNRINQTVDLGDPDFIDFSINNKINIELTGDQHMIYMGMPGYEGMMEDLKKYSNPIVHQITREDITTALHELKNKLELPKLAAPRREDLINTYVNDKSYSGLMTSLMAGHSKKESLEFSTIMAEKLFEVVGSRLTVDTSLKVVGAREKLVKSDKFGSRMQTRALIQEESMNSQLKQLYARPITSALKKLNVDWESSIGIGGVLLGNGVAKFIDKFYPNNGLEYSIVTMDAASHDKNVCSELIIASYSILRSCFPESSVIDNHFFFFMSGHDYKRVMTDDGFIFNIRGGIQTGDPMTSLVNSICMLLEKTILYKKLNIEQPIKQVYYGDDQWEVFSKGVKIPENIGEISEEHLGIRMKDVIIKKSSEEFSDDYSKEPSFLQIYFKDGLPVRDPKRIYEKLYFMDPKLRDDPSEKLEAVMSMAYSAHGFNYSKTLVTEYAKFLKRKYKIYTTYEIEERLNYIIMNLATSNIGLMKSNVRGEYEYARKKHVVCDTFRYNYMKETVFHISPILIDHIMGKVRFKNIGDVVKKYKKYESYMHTIKKILLEHEKYKQRNNLYWFLKTSPHVFGN